MIQNSSNIIPKEIPNHKAINFIVAALCITVIYLLPLLINPVYYIDDIGRVITGSWGWLGNGRPFSQYFFQFLTGNNTVDIHPLPLLLGVSAILYAGWHIYINLFPNSPYISAAAVSIILSNPFYLENLSYRFESMMMGFSVGLAILSAIILSKISPLRILISISLLFSMMCFYQASLGLYLTISIIVQCSVLLKSSENKPFLYRYKHLISSAAVLLASFGLYKLIYGDLVNSNEYDRLHSQLIPFSHEGLIIFIDNINRFYGIIKLPLIGHNGYFYGVLLIGGFTSSLFLAIKLLALKRWIDSLFLALAPFLVVIASLITLCILKEPVFAARTLIGTSGVLLFFFYSLYYVGRNILALPIFAFLFITSLTINYAYANAVKAQQEQEYLILNQLAADIKTEDASINEIIIIGREKFSDKGLLSTNTFPVIQLLVPRVLNNQWYWGYMLLKHHPETRHLKQYKDASQFVVTESKLIAERSLYKLWICRNRFILQFK